MRMLQKRAGRMIVKIFKWDEYDEYIIRIQQYLFYNNDKDIGVDGVTNDNDNKNNQKAFG